MTLLPDSMPSSKSLIWGIIGEIVRKIDPTKKTSKGLVEILLALLGVAILFCMATAPFKILLRRNFGHKAISTLEIVFGAFFFGLWSYITASILLSYGHIEYSSGYKTYLTHPIVLIAIAMIFGITALMVLILGFPEQSKSHFKESDNWIEENYRGDSLLFKSKIKTDKMLFRVWKSHEPGFCFKWSFLLLIIHPLLGFPFVFASIAFWVNEFYHVTFKWEKLIAQSNPVSPSTSLEQATYIAN